MMGVVSRIITLMPPITLAGFTPRTIKLQALCPQSIQVLFAYELGSYRRA